MSRAAASAAARAALRLGVLAVLAVGLLQGIQLMTADRIAAQQQRQAEQALMAVMPASRFDNRLAEDRIAVSAPRWLGSAEPVAVHRARRDGESTGLVIAAVAPDGYAAGIHMLIGIDAAHSVLGVRVTRHAETPGLGDPIDRQRSDWITGFDGRSLQDPPLSAWRVRKDGGAFDQFVGATITPRAMVNAVRRALQFVDRHGAQLREAEAGSLLEFTDGPDS